MGIEGIVDRVRKDRAGSLAGMGTRGGNGGWGTGIRRLGNVVGALAIAFAGSANVAAAPPSQPEGFIVVLRDGQDAHGVARDHAARFQANVQFVYEHALRGYAGRIAPGHIAALSADSRVAFVERDGTVTASTTQSGATWGLDRIDQRQGLDGSYTYTNTGAGVTAYVIDTGVQAGHTEFAGAGGGSRVSAGYTAIADGNGTNDCHGHGTHVAGTIGGATYGVAKGVGLVAVRVLDCSGSGSTSGVIAGVDWVAAHHAGGQPAVANMSLGGSASSALDQAVGRMIQDGVATAVAAGNGNKAGVAQDACKSSPARVGAAMTVSATDQTDTKTSWANYGSCVDWFAPGSGITSAWLSGGTRTISGTSMATPHTAGVAALYLQANPASSPQQVRDALYANTTKGAVKSSRTTNNHLLFSSY